MVKDFNTNNAPFSLVIGIQTSGPQHIRIEALDKSKPYCYYERLQGIVNGYQEFVLSFPIAPQTLTLGVYNASGQNPSLNEGFKITKFEAGKVKTKNISLTAKDREYIKFLYEFAENKGLLTGDTILNGKKVPSIYSSDNCNFKFLLYNNLIDPKTKAEMNTPAMIGNDSGDVNWSKAKIQSYTVPMVVMIGLHEYSHKFKNPQAGLAIGNEMGADLNGLNIYRSLGFLREPAEHVFGVVFAGADGQLNRQRMKIIKNFNNDYDNGKIDQYYSEFAPPVKKWAA